MSYFSSVSDLVEDGVKAVVEVVAGVVIEDEDADREAVTAAEDAAVVVREEVEVMRDDVEVQALIDEEEVEVEIGDDQVEVMKEENEDEDQEVGVMIVVIGRCYHVMKQSPLKREIAVQFSVCSWRGI